MVPKECDREKKSCGVRPKKTFWRVLKGVNGHLCFLELGGRETKSRGPVNRQSGKAFSC